MDDQGDDRGRTLLTAGVVGVGGYLAYKWWVEQRLKEALFADAQKQLQKNPGMSIKDAMTNAAAGACTVAASVYKIPPAAGAPMCQGLAVVATKAVELGAKGALIAGKAIGKAAKAVGYTAPKKVIGVTKKVAKKVVCAGGLFCGVDGLDDADATAYRDRIDLALGGARSNPMRRVERARVTRRGGNPFALAALEPRPAIGAAARPSVRAVGRSQGRRQSRAPMNGAAVYERLLR